VKALFEVDWSTREDSRLRFAQFGQHEQEAAPKSGRAR
jgi:hypothetical protein